MGADRAGGGRRRTARAAVYALCGAVLLAGCASMPDSGDLRGVESTARQDTQVRVFAMPPHEDASPSEIVQGFLEALTSDDPNYETARKYLTAGAARAWRPKTSTTVLEDTPQTAPEPVGSREDGRNITFTMSGLKVATVNEQQSYVPVTGSYSRSVHLTKDPGNGQWRIDAPPRGVVMGKSDFQRNYMSVNKYYFASNSEAGESPQPTAVADPVYVRRRVDPMTQMVRSVLNGPTRWLDPVVRSSFPTGTELPGSEALAPDDQNRLTVPLNARAARAGRGRCEEMAAQLLFTLQHLTPAVDEVELRSGGKHLCSLEEEHADTVAALSSQQHPEYLYFLDEKRRLARMAADNDNFSVAEPVPGALGEGGTELRAAAVSRDEHTAAGVSLDGKKLYVGALVSGGSLGDAVLASKGKTEGNRLTTPSWDVRGDLWVADRNPANPRLLLLEKGAGEPVEVETPGLDGQIRAVRVAADGVRIALVVEQDGKRSLLIGRIERGDRSDDRPTVTVLELRSATPRLEEVTAMSWAGDSRLVVVGREEGGVQQMRYVQSDGSTPEEQAPTALTGVEEIAACQDDAMPLVANSEDGIVRMPPGDQWQKVTEGTAPVYPG